MARLLADQLEDGVAMGREHLAKNPEAAARAVLIYDGYVTLESGRTDALFIEARRYGGETRVFTMCVPYWHAHSPGGFAVYRPKFLSFEGPGPDFTALGEAFFRGVGLHEEGAAVWNRHLDESR